MGSDGVKVEREEWRLIFDDFYEVSSLGNVRRAKPGTATFAGRPVIPLISAGGYAQVQLCAAGSRRRAYVHHLVAEAFIGPRPDGHVINHLDGVKTNNAAANLEYTTPRGNSQHALAKGRRRGPTKPKAPLKGPQLGDAHWSRRMPEKVVRGELQGGSKLTESKVRAMRSERAAGKKVQEVADAHGVSLAQASRVLRGERWGHVK